MSDVRAVFGEASTHLSHRRRKAAVFKGACVCFTWLSVVLLAVLIMHVCMEGVHWLRWDFLTSPPSAKPEKAGLYSALIGTLWLISVTGIIAVPLGVAAALYLEEYSQPSKLNTIIEVNLTNLAGVPSIMYGLLGLTVFVRWLGMGRSVLAGALTMSLLILPVIIMAAREAIRAVPSSIRQAALAVGATRWQTVRDHVLPSALPGILTGVILALSRAIGETAPLLTIGALAYVRSAPSGLMDDFSALPIQIYTWAQKPQEEFLQLAASGIIVLLAVLLLMNSAAVIIRHRSQRNQQW